MALFSRPPTSLRPPSPPMLDALAALAGGDFQSFRVGYARNIHGPFFLFGTVGGLILRGLAAASPGRRRVSITRSGRAMLEAQEQAA